MMFCLQKKTNFFIFIFLCFATSFSFAQDTIRCNKLIEKGIDDMMNLRYASAIQNLTKSQQMAQAGNWTKQQFLAANNLGLTYYKMMDYGNALIHLLEAYELAVIQQNETNEMNIAILYIKEQKIEQAEVYFLKSFLPRG